MSISDFKEQVFLSLRFIPACAGNIINGTYKNASVTFDRGKRSNFNQSISPVKPTSIGGFWI